MNALQSLLSASRPATLASPAKVQGTTEPARQFGQLLSALSVEAPNQEAAAEESPGQLQLTELAAALEQLMELPAEQLTEEQQALQYAIFQLLALPDEQQVMAAIEAAVPDQEMQERIAALIAELKTSAAAGKEFAQPKGFAGVQPSETAPPEQTPEETIRPLIELLERIDKQPTASEKLLLIKELAPLQEARVSFAQPPAGWLQALMQKETAEPASGAAEIAEPPGEAEELPAAAIPKPVLETEETAPKAETQQPAALPQTPVQPAAGADTKAMDAPVRQVPVQKLADTLAEWIAEPARLSAGGNETRLRINIFPEHLGHLEILVSTVAGKVSAQIVASHGAAKEAVEFQLNQLRAALVQQGVEVEHLEVREDRSASGFSKNDQQREAPNPNPSGDNGGRRSENGESASAEGGPPPKRSSPAAAASGQVDYTV